MKTPPLPSFNKSEEEDTDNTESADASYFAASQDYNPQQNSFVDTLTSFETNRPDFKSFQETLMAYQKDWSIRTPKEYKQCENFNIFHYMALVKITIEDKQSFINLFDTIFKTIPNAQAYLFDRVDYARSHSISDPKLQSPPKVKPLMRPLDYAVVNEAYYYAKLIIKRIISGDTLKIGYVSSKS